MGKKWWNTLMDIINFLMDIINFLENFIVNLRKFSKYHWKNYSYRFEWNKKKSIATTKILNMGRIQKFWCNTKEKLKWEAQIVILLSTVYFPVCNSIRGFNTIGGVGNRINIKVCGGLFEVFADQILIKISLFGG